MRHLFFVLLVALAPASFAAPTLEAPATAQAGSTIKLRATGSGNPREFVTVVPKGSAEGSYREYVYVKAGELSLPMPVTAGDFELRLCAAGSPYKTLVAKPIKVLMAEASIKGPAAVDAGAHSR